LREDDHGLDEIDLPLPRERSAQKHFWWVFIVVAGMASCIFAYGFGRWSWDHDEVASLVELGIVHLREGIGQGSQLERLPKLVPVWYGMQGLLLHYLPINEWGTRLLPVTCGILAVVCAFLLAARHWGLNYAFALALLLNGAQCLVWLAQQNRFYSMALLFFVLTLAAVWSRAPGVKRALLCALLAALTILSHNLFVVVFGLAFVASCLAYAQGHVPKSVLVRFGIAALTGVLLYLLHLRPIMQNWISGDTGGSHPLVSFAAQAGIPTLALAGFGSFTCLHSPEARRRWTWWVVFFGLGLAFVGVSPVVLKAWNPRYAVLFMPPMWVLAAHGMVYIARCLSSRPLMICWYCCVALLLLPKLASHYQDGSRHDFRTAAEVLIRKSHSEQPLLCNYPETLFYYLPEQLRPGVRTWVKEDPIPPTECFIVHASTHWEPLLRYEGRPVELLEEITKRRFDEQSHVIRIYHVGARHQKGVRSFLFSPGLQSRQKGT
jgi:hypothetical protein